MPTSGEMGWNVSVTKFRNVLRKKNKTKIEALYDVIKDSTQKE